MSEHYTRALHYGGIALLSAVTALGLPIIKRSIDPYSHTPQVKEYRTATWIANNIDDSLAEFNQTRSLAQSRLEVLKGDPTVLSNASFQHWFNSASIASLGLALGSGAMCVRSVAKGNTESQRARPSSIPAVRARSVTYQVGSQ